jgi:hypothetical protein
MAGPDENKAPAADKGKQKAVDGADNKEIAKDKDDKKPELPPGTSFPPPAVVVEADALK